MGETKWATFEDQVRDIAGHIFGKKCQPKTIAGVNFDGVIEISKDRWVIVETTLNHTLDKVRGDINRLTMARNALWRDGIYCESFMIMQREPTKAMVEAAETVPATIAKVDSFAALFIEYERYRIARLTYPFGSAVNPQDGTTDDTRYVNVNYVSKKDNRDVSVSNIADLIYSGKNVILLGEYGSRKSRCIRQCFEIMSSEWGARFQFPIAVNLRESWGLKRADEILRRHADSLGLDDLKPQIVKAYNSRDTILFLDGFDELGIQAWDTDEEKLAQIRASVLQGVRELVQQSKHGILIAGREHYFSNQEEMLSALGCKPKDTVILYAKSEFTEDEMRQYFIETDIDVTLPNWLPRKPLICQTIAQLSDDEVASMFGTTSSEATFWEHFVNVLCERDAKIHPAFSAKNILEILLELARVTRTKSANVGPITQKDLQDAFEKVVGQRPVEEASALLQRLPTLGRIAAETPDLQFVDSYILDGLRGSFVAKIAERSENQREAILQERWSNPLGALGQVILLQYIEKKWPIFSEIAQRSTKSPNTTLAADIASSMIRTSKKFVDLSGMHISNAAFAELDFSQSAVKGFRVSDSIIEELVIPPSPPVDVKLENCLVHRVFGVSAASGLPSWATAITADEYDSVRTISRIRNAGLSPAHEALVGIIKKTFFQPGSGRKEEALTRGFGDGPGKNIAPKILKILTREGVLSTFKGNEGLVYAPTRAQAGRMGQMLEQLRSSNDPLWLEVGQLS
jgi:hypothetical protein